MFARVSTSIDVLLKDIAAFAGYSRRSMKSRSSGRRHLQVRFEIEPVAKILSRIEDVLEERAIAVARDHRLDQVDLIHRDQLQEFGARPAAGVARQSVYD